MSKPFVFNLSAAITSSPPQQPLKQALKELPIEDTLAFVLSNDEAAQSKKQIKLENRGLGTWIFDRKTRKRRYVSLTGKNFFGHEAVSQSKKDKISELHPANSARAELKYLMTTMAPQHLDDLFTSGPGSGSFPLIANDPLDIGKWGVPLRVVNKYASLGVSKMFPWQIECLGVDDGKALKGGILIFFIRLTFKL